jgi:hypothetical protein
VVILPGAFGPGMPAKNLALSPSHCVYVDGVLIPVTHLVNGATILRDRQAAAMTYYHIELDRHDILLAEGLPTESYFDDGNRGALYHEIGRRWPARHLFAPVVTRGARLAAVRRHLHKVALSHGFFLSTTPKLRVVAAGQSVIPEFRAGRHGMQLRFTLPEPAREMLLLPEISAPAETDPEAEDWREFSLCVAELPGLDFGKGFFSRGPGDAGRWAGASAALGLSHPARKISLRLVAVAPVWRKSGMRKPVLARLLEQGF